MKTAEKNAAHLDKKDSETGVDIDPKSERLSAAWWSKDKSTSVATILNAIVTDIQKKAVKAQEA